MAMTGYTVRDIDTVLRSAYGTPLEIAQLLNVMLNAAGIPSEVLAVYPGHLDYGRLRAGCHPDTSRKSHCRWERPIPIRLPADKSWRTR